jgi:hypothetical protein
VNHTSAYGLADAYIYAADCAADTKTVVSYMRDAPIHFATEVNKVKKLSPYSLKALRSIE